MSGKVKVKGPKGLTLQPEIGLGYPSAPSLTVSVVLHAVVVSSLTMITFAPRPEPPEPKAPPLPPTVVKIGDRIFMVSRISAAARPAKAPPRPEKAPEPKKVALKKLLAKAAAPPSTVETPAENSGPAPKAFAPPEAKENFISDATLLQPLSPPDLVPVVPQLPSFRIWTAPIQMPKIPKPFVAPGRRTESPPDLTPPPPPPELELVHADPVVSELKSALVLPATPPPLFDTQTPKPANDAQPRAPVGDPVNIISLNDRPVPPSDKLVVPPGNVIGRLGDGTSPVFGAGSTGTNGNSPNDVAAANRPASPGVTGPMVIVRPSNGTFDAMIIQSSSLDQFPETKTLLQGRPIYTVYISVGSPKDWALYFCLRGEKAPPTTPQNVVVLEAGPPVQAPYPTRLVRPGIVAPAYYKYILVHGYVNAGGRFENLRVVRATKPETDEAIIASLTGWEFRPATKDGVKVPVEFVLSIPVAGL